MAFEIIRAVSTSLSDKVIHRLGDTLGENEQRTRSGVLAAIPTILKGLVRSASTPEGEALLEKELKSHDGSILNGIEKKMGACLLYTSPSPRDLSTSRMPSSA